LRVNVSPVVMVDGVAVKLVIGWPAVQVAMVAVGVGVGVDGPVGLDEHPATAATENSTHRWLHSPQPLALILALSTSDA